jgi:hypothetical protein
LSLKGVSINQSNMSRVFGRRQRIK